MPIVASDVFVLCVNVNFSDAWRREKREEVVFKQTPKQLRCQAATDRRWTSVIGPRRRRAAQPMGLFK